MFLKKRGLEKDLGRGISLAVFLLILTSVLLTSFWTRTQWVVLRVKPVEVRPHKCLTTPKGKLLWQVGLVFMSMRIEFPSDFLLCPEGALKTEASGDTDK